MKKRLQKRRLHNNELYTVLTTDILQELDFKDNGKSIFESYKSMSYWVKDCVCLFYNTPVATDYQESFYIGYGEHRQGKYTAVTFKWIDSVEELTEIYQALKGVD